MINEVDDVQQDNLSQTSETFDLASVLKVEPKPYNHEEEMALIKAKVEVYLERIKPKPEQFEEEEIFTSLKDQEVNGERKKADKYWQEIAPKENIFQRGKRAFNRARTVRELAQKRKGTESPRKEADELVKHFEKNGMLLYTGFDLKGNRSRQQTIDYSRLSSPTFLRKTATLKEPLQTIQKVEAFLGIGWERLLWGWTPTEEVTEMLQLIEAAPVEVIQNIQAVLSQLPEVAIDTLGYYDGSYGDKSYRSPDHPKIFACFINILRNNGFNEDQLRYVEAFQVYKKLIPSEAKGMPLGMILIDGEKIVEKVKVATQVISAIEGKKAELQSSEFVLTSDSLNGIVELIVSNETWITTAFLDQMDSSPLKISPKELFSLSANTFGTKDNVEEKQEKKLKLLKDPNLDEIALLAQYEGQSLDTANFSDYANALELLKSLPDQVVAMSDNQRLRTINAFGNFNPTLRKLFQQMVVTKDGVVSQALVLRAYDEAHCHDTSLLEFVPDQDKEYYTYLLNIPIEMMSVLRDHKQEFSSLVVKGIETAKLMKIFAQKVDNTIFVNFLTKQRLASLYGKESAENFLAALPKKTDERRNALTHNEYDRTSVLLHVFSDYKSIRFDNPDDIHILTKYIVDYGLAQSHTFFNYFKQLSLYEMGKITELPPVLIESNITNTKELFSQIEGLKLQVMSQKPLGKKELDAFSPMQLLLLEVVTGMTTHRFNDGRPRFGTIVDDYKEAEEKGEIAAVPKGFRSVTFELKNRVVEFDPAPIKQDFEIIQAEILNSIEAKDEVADLTIVLSQLFSSSIEGIDKALTTLPDKAREAANKNRENLLVLKQEATRLKTLDDFLIFLLKVNLGKSEQVKIESLKRKVILRRLFQKHFSPGFIQELQMNVRGEINPTAITSCVNVINDLVKQHSLNLNADQEGAANYWTPEAYKALELSIKSKRHADVFGGISTRLKKAVDDFKYLEDGSTSRVECIPSRDFVAEVAGYIADVCYTKEYPLLKDRKVVPYKFVVKGETAAQDELGGSVLAFDVTDSDGNQCLLVRAFDFVNESSINISLFIEQFLDEMAIVAKARGMKKVIIPGASGAVSNYQMTINHLGKYNAFNNHVTLAENFSFNGYNLTNNCYVARTIQ